MSNIASLVLKNDHAALPDYMQREQETAIADLVARGQFQPAEAAQGPYNVALSLEDGRLVLRMKDAQDKDLTTHVLALGPYRRVITDYFMMIESYEAARNGASCGKLEAIDMGRRGVHNEGAELLQSRLKDKINIDHTTARGLFTLICTLQKSAAHLAL